MVPLNEKPEEELEPIAMIGVPALFSNHQPDPVPCAVIPDLKMDPLAMFRVPVILSVPSVPLVAVMAPVIVALVAVSAPAELTRNSALAGVASPTQMR